MIYVSIRAAALIEQAADSVKSAAKQELLTA